MAQSLLYAEIKGDKNVEVEVILNTEDVSISVIFLKLIKNIQMKLKKNKTVPILTRE